MTLAGLVALTLLAVLSASHFFAKVARSGQSIPLEVELLYARWRAQNQKLYFTAAEGAYRMKVFWEQKQYVDKANSRYESAILRKYGDVLDEPMFSLNSFADLNEEEFGAKYTGDRDHPQTAVQDRQLSSEQRGLDAGLTSVQDGLGQGYDLRIRYQGSCGSCWAFAAIASIEKLYFDKFGARLDLSQQELIDCDMIDRGCDGGMSEEAMAYIRAYGISLASDYPYIAAERTCRRNSTARITVPVIVPPMRGFSLALANAYSARGYHATLSVYANGDFRYFSKSPTPFDASVSPDCNKSKNHAVNLLSAADGIVTIFNSWSVKWAVNGTKAIKPCSPSNLLGAAGRIAHPYGG